MKYTVIENLCDLPNLDVTAPTFCDIETNGLYINTRLVQVYQPTTIDEIFIIDIDYCDLEETKNILRPLHTVWYNASYDFGTLNMTTEKFDDLFYLVRNAYPEWQEYSLDKTVSRLGFDDLYGDLDKKALQKQGFVNGAYLSQAQLRYSATDVYALAKMWDNPQIQQYRELLAYKVDILSMGYAIKYQQNGLQIGQPLVREELDKLIDDIERNYDILGTLNPNSPKQCKEYFGTDKTDKATMIKLISQGNEMAKVVYEQRRLLKRRKMLETYNFPKVYTRYNVAGAVSGRFTATGGDMPQGINAQQIPRDLQYLFNQDTEDTVCIEADFGTAELRAAASIMKEPQMYKELMEGEDLHKIAATMVNGKDLNDITKEDRQKGKAVSFGLIFGMSAPSFKEYAFVSYGVSFTDEEAAAIKKNYQDRYKAIKKYHTSKWEHYKAEIAVTALGRRARARLGTDAINIPTQGTIAETTKLSIHYAVQEDERILGYIYNVVHDQINLRVPRDEVNYWQELLVRNMEKGWSEICKTKLMTYKNIPMPVDAEHAQ